MHSSGITLKPAYGWREQLPLGFPVIPGFSVTNCFSLCRVTQNSNA